MTSPYGRFDREDGFATSGRNWTGRMCSVVVAARRGAYPTVFPPRKSNLLVLQNALFWHLRLRLDLFREGFFGAPGKSWLDNGFSSDVVRFVFVGCPPKLQFLTRQSKSTPSMLLKWGIEAQGRGFAHGHRKTHSYPAQSWDLLQLTEEQLEAKKRRVCAICLLIAI